MKTITLTKLRDAKTGRAIKVKVPKGVTKASRAKTRALGAKFRAAIDGTDWQPSPLAVRICTRFYGTETTLADSATPLWQIIDEEVARS